MSFALGFSHFPFGEYDFGTPTWIDDGIGLSPPVGGNGDFLGVSARRIGIDDVLVWMMMMITLSISDGTTVEDGRRNVRNFSWFAF